MKNIIKYILAVFIFFATLSANTINECKTDIYFGNGVWNKVFTNDCEEDSAANCSQDVLNDLVQSEIIKNDPKLQAKYGEVKLQYNWGQGTMTDVLETYYQLKEAGQVQDYQFYAVIAILTRGNPALTISAIAYQELMEPFTRGWEEGNAYEMWEKYYHESFKLSHKVLLVSHSQGNLFANRVYEKIAPTKYQAYFANLQVASPASEIKAEKGDYVTGFIDPIINPIPGSMTSNADLDFPGGHKFVEAYLSSSDTLSKITKKMKQLLANLDTESSQWELDQELNKGTADYKITLKHRFDTAITSMQNVEVYPFKPSAKLYRVTDNTSGGNGWVKASCGGEEVFNSWISQQVNEVYLINNPEEEKILLECLETQYLDSLTNECKEYMSYKFTYNGTIEVNAEATKKDHHYEGGYIEISGYYRGGYIIYDAESNIEASAIEERGYSAGGIFTRSNRNGFENQTKVYCEDENPIGSYLLHSYEIIILDKNTFKVINGYTQVGGGIYQNCYLGFLWELDKYFGEGIWPSAYYHPDTRWEGGVGFEIWNTSYEVTRYGTITGIK